MCFLRPRPPGGHAKGRAVEPAPGARRWYLPDRFAGLWFDARLPSEEALAAAEELAREYEQCLHLPGVEQRVKLALYGAIVDDVVVGHNFTDAHGVALPLGEGFWAAVWASDPDLAHAVLAAPTDSFNQGLSA